MQRNTAVDFKVGIFVFIGVIILVFLILFIGDFKIFKPGYNFKMIFNFTNGLQESAPVRLAGVEVGQVEAIKILIDQDKNDLKVEVKVWVIQEAKIPKDSEIEINTLGVLGQKYIEIIPGVDFSQLVRAEDVLIGHDPVPMYEFASLGKRVVLKIEDSVNRASEFLNDEELKLNLKSSIYDLKQLVEFIKDGNGTLGRLIFEKKLYNDLEEMVADVKANPWKLIHKEKEK